MKGEKIVALTHSYDSTRGEDPALSLNEPHP